MLESFAIVPFATAHLTITNFDSEGWTTTMGIKPHVVYFSEEQEMVDLVQVTLSERFHVTPVVGLFSIDEALDTLRQTRPDFVIVDPHLPSLDHQELSRRLKADGDLKDIQILIVRDEA